MNLFKLFNKPKDIEALKRELMPHEYRNEDKYLLSNTHATATFYSFLRQL